MKSPSVREKSPPPFPRPLRSQRRHRQINRRLQRTPQRRQQTRPSRFPPKRDVSPANAASISLMSADRAAVEKSLLPIYPPLPNPTPLRRPRQLTVAAPSP